MEAFQAQPIQNQREKKKPRRFGRRRFDEEDVSSSQDDSDSDGSQSFHSGTNEEDGSDAEGDEHGEDRERSQDDRPESRTEPRPSALNRLKASGSSFVPSSRPPTAPTEGAVSRYIEPRRHEEGAGPEMGRQQRFPIDVTSYFSALWIFDRRWEERAGLDH